MRNWSKISFKTDKDRKQGEMDMYYVMDSRIVPQIHLADYWILKPPCAHKKRVPHEYIAYLIQKGELYLAEDGITYHLCPGDFILLDPEKYQFARRER